MKKIGLIINPIAGIGGKVGLRGSDGSEIQNLAAERGATRESEIKAEIALKEFLDMKDKLKIYTAPETMGENLVKKLGFDYEVVGTLQDAQNTDVEDTKKIAQAIKDKDVELLIFAGGDGTARDIFDVLETGVHAIGVPTGVKIHSAVYANNPKSAGEAVHKFLEDPEGIDFVLSEVMDLNEDEYRKGNISTKLYGYLSVPRIGGLVQNPKSPSDFNKFDLEGIADEINYTLNNFKDVYYIFSTGATTYKIMETLGFQGSLLGVDVVYNGELVLKDAMEEELFNLIKGKNSKLYVSIIGGQGHILGRGNHQLSPRIIREIKKENVQVLSSMDKISSLEGRPILTDTSDPDLDEELSGYTKVLIGSKEFYMYRISH